MLKINNQSILFFDPGIDSNISHPFQNITHIKQGDRPFILKLNSSQGLGNINHIQTKDDELRLVYTLNENIKQSKSHSVLNDIAERLAKVYSVNQSDITIQKLFTGSINMVYTVAHSTGSKIEPSEVIDRLRKNFDQFIELKIHPLLHRPIFDISMFDDRGNKISHRHLILVRVDASKYIQRLLVGHNSDYWLDPFQHPQNWYRAFHGTGNAQNSDFDEKDQSSDTQFMPVDALASIYQSGFRTARNAAYGQGVYCSPNPKFPESGYIRAVSIEIKNDKKSYKCMLQVAVNPDGVAFHTNNEIWVVGDPKNIRPYGILIKEA